MAESFEVRVKLLFGSQLFESLPGLLPGDLLVRRRRRGRAADRGDTPCFSAFYDDGGCFSKKSERPRDFKEQFEAYLDERDDGEEGAGGGGEDGNEGGSDGEREEREIRSSVCLDPTLDNEVLLSLYLHTNMMDGDIAFSLQEDIMNVHADHNQGMVEEEHQPIYS